MLNGFGLDSYGENWVGGCPDSQDDPARPGSRPRRRAGRPDRPDRAAAGRRDLAVTVLRPILRLRPVPNRGDDQVRHCSPAWRPGTDSLRHYKLQERGSSGVFWEGWEEGSCGDVPVPPFGVVEGAVIEEGCDASPTSPRLANHALKLLRNML